MESGLSPYLIHSGENFSFSLFIESDKKAMILDFPDGEKTRIELKKERSKILGAYPSVCGSIVYCLLKSGKELFYNTQTGEKVPMGKLIGTDVKFNV